MKRNLIFAALLLVMMVALPVTALGFRGGAPQENTPAIVTKPSSKENTAENAAAAGKQDDPESIPVMRSATGAVEEIGLEEYLRGCVAAEMPLGYHIEALKAQAVASSTYARHRLAEGKEAVSDSGESDQSYLTPAQRKEKWGDSYDTYEKKLGEAVAAVLGEQIVWKGEPILAVFHAVSSGLTESAEEYWGGEYPYLLSVSSPGDRLCPEYIRTVAFTPAEIKAALKDEKGVTLGEDASAWFGEAKASDAGTVKSIMVGGKELSGQRLRTLLNLRSANFSVSHKDGVFSVRTVGYGHGVGMSQYGADFMARQGSGYKEILAYYYNGCEVV